MKRHLQILTKSILLCISLLFLGNVTSHAQTNSDTSHHKVLLGGIVVGRDTFPLDYIPTIFIGADMDPEAVVRLDKLRYNVAKVYPYAVTAAYVLKSVDEKLGQAKNRRSRKEYIRETQKALDGKFKDELKNLTTTQGQILVKLINRETGRNCYDVIKELKGGFNARISQTMAFFFDNNLKAEYDPNGKDRDIEMIVQDIETKNYYQYQSRIMEARAALNKK